MTLARKSEKKNTSIRYSFPTYFPTETRRQSSDSGDIILEDIRIANSNFSNNLYRRNFSPENDLHIHQYVLKIKEGAS